MWLLFLGWLVFCVIALATWHFCCFRRKLKKCQKRAFQQQQQQLAAAAPAPVDVVDVERGQQQHHCCCCKEAKKKSWKKTKRRKRAPLLLNAAMQTEMPAFFLVPPDRYAQLSYELARRWQRPKRPMPSNGADEFQQQQQQQKSAPDKLFLFSSPTSPKEDKEDRRRREWRRRRQRYFNDDNDDEGQVQEVYIRLRHPSAGDKDKDKEEKTEEEKEKEKKKKEDDNDAWKHCRFEEKAMAPFGTPVLCMDQICSMFAARKDREISHRMSTSIMITPGPSTEGILLIRRMRDLVAPYSELEPDDYVCEKTEPTHVDGVKFREPEIDGIPWHALDKLPAKTLTEQHAFVADEQCPICLEHFRLEEAVSQSDCGTHFHHKCLATWLAQRRTCPMCRTLVDGFDVWGN